MPNEENEYQRHSLDGLLTAVEYGDRTAHSALREFIRLRTGGRNTIVERHPERGWRVRDPLDEE
jgi:hypothetical protein